MHRDGAVFGTPQRGLTPQTGFQGKSLGILEERFYSVARDLGACMMGNVWWFRGTGTCFAWLRVGVRCPSNLPSRRWRCIERCHSETRV